MNVTPVMNFPGTCEAAVRFYEYVFSTKAEFILRYSDARPEDWNRPLTEEQKNFVYHAEMKIGNQRFMFSDIIEFKVVAGNAQFFTCTFATKDEVEKAYERISDGCTIVYPLKSTTYSSRIVNLIDKFGIRWGLMTEQTEK